MNVFIDTSVWFAAANVRDRYNRRAKQILGEIEGPVLSDHVLVESWRLIRDKVHRNAAESFWSGVRQGVAELEKVTTADLEAAWAIGEAFQDQEFSIVDRTTFALMQRIGISSVASFDEDFAVYRYGRKRDKAFTVLR